MRRQDAGALLAIIAAVVLVLLLTFVRACNRRRDDFCPWRAFDEEIATPGLVTITREGHWESPPSSFVPITVDREGNLAMLLKKGRVLVSDRRISSAIGRGQGVQRGIVLLVADDAPIQSLVPAHALANRHEAYLVHMCAIRERGMETIYTTVEGGFLPFMMHAVPSDAVQYDLVVEPTHAMFRDQPVSPSEFASALQRLSFTVPGGSEWYVHIRACGGARAAYTLEYAAVCTALRVSFLLTVED